MIGEKVVVPRSIACNGLASSRELPASSTGPYTPHILSHPSHPNLINGSAQEALESTSSYPESAIAVVGLACRYPDADSVEEFWDLINAGKCAVREMPKDRFDPSELQREPRGPFWGGYVRRLDAFDHRFFGISGREATSMDPQQRLCLQVAYEAMESSGYFGLKSSCSGSPTTNVGCYIGVANDDYVANVASHPANAFSAGGTLRAFISGRINHFFGWSGPAITKTLLALQLQLRYIPRAEHSRMAIAPRLWRGVCVP